MKVKFILAAMLLSSSAFGQEELHRGNWGIGLSFAPGYSYRTHYVGKSNDYLDRENFKYGWDASLNVSRKLGRIFSLETGVFFSKFEFNSFNSTPDGVLATWPYFPVSFEDRFVRNYVGIPIRAMARIGKSKVKFLVGIDFSPAYLLVNQRTEIRTYKDGKKESKTYSMLDTEKNQFNLFAGLIAGIDYTFARHWSLRLQPSFKFGVINVTKDTSPYQTYVWNLGCNVGCYYHF